MPSYDARVAQLAITLSSLAYVDENKNLSTQQMSSDIDAGLSAAGFQSWRVVWGPALSSDQSNLVYVARNNATGQLAVSIRGTDPSSWLDWLQDLALTLVPYDQFVRSAEGSAQIACGAALGLGHILEMKDASNSLEAFLRAAAKDTAILITGHSLGGCLASALAPCVANWLGRSSGISVYTFAAPSPGNQEFASYYNALFTQSGHSTAFRFFNSLDVVPNAWASLETVEGYFPSLVSCPAEIKEIISRAQNLVSGGYCQLGDPAASSAIELAGRVITLDDARIGGVKLNPVGDVLFLWELGKQHAYTTYQALLQAPLTVPGIGSVKRALAALKHA